MNLIAVLGIALVPISYGTDIVPGGRIGNVRIGHDVPAILGQPTSSDGAAGHIWSTWKGATGNTLDTYAVIGDSEPHEVRLVRVTSAWFQTASGVHTGQTYGSIKTKYASTLVTTYDSHQFSRKLAIRDNKSKGIAFEFTVNSAGHVTNSSRCKAIWVHKKNSAFDASSWLVYEPTRP